MPHNMTAAMEEALGQKVLRPRYIAELDFADEPVRVWSGIGILSWDGKSWTGVGDFGGIGDIEERGKVEADTLRLQLNGVPLANKALALARQNYQGRAAQIWLALMDEDEALIDAPVPVFAGPMDFMVVSETADSATITLEVSSELVDLSRQRVLYYTAADQRVLFPGDTFFDFVPSATEEILW